MWPTASLTALLRPQDGLLLEQVSLACLPLFSEFAHFLPTGLSRTAEQSLTCCESPSYAWPYPNPLYLIFPKFQCRYHHKTFLQNEETEAHRG